MDTKRQPRERHEQVTVPLGINLLVVFLTARFLAPRPCSTPVALELCLADQTREVAKDTHEPGAVGPAVYLAGGDDLALVVPAQGGLGKDVLVDQEREVFEGLEADIGDALGQGDGVQGPILVWLRALGQGAEPDVKREEAEEAQGGARAAKNCSEGRDAGGTGRGTTDWGFGRFDCGCGCDIAIIVDEFEEKLRERRKGWSLGLEVAQEVESVVECREEGGEAAWRGEEPATLS